jgi:hypothetical protein
MARFLTVHDIRGMCSSWRICVLVAVVLVAGCGDRKLRWLSSSEPPSAAEAATIPAGMPLGDLLQRIEAELDTAITGHLDTDALPHLTRAEAMTDRLPESRLPFGWLAVQHYSLEARLWQIQARADRVLAEIRIGVRREDVVSDVEALREQIATLRSALAAGGAQQPESIERILNRMDSPRITRPDTSTTPVTRNPQ